MGHVLCNDPHFHTADTQAKGKHIDLVLSNPCLIPSPLVCITTVSPAVVNLHSWQTELKERFINF